MPRRSIGDGKDALLGVLLLGIEGQFVDIGAGLNQGVLPVAAIPLLDEGPAASRKHRQMRHQPTRQIVDSHPHGPFDRDLAQLVGCLLYTSPSPRDRQKSRMPSSA